MASKDFVIQHFKDDQLHGPVHLIVADDGRMGLHCSVDDQSWDLPRAIPTSDDATAGKDTEMHAHLAHSRPLEVAVSDDLLAATRSERPKTSTERFARAHFK